MEHKRIVINTGKSLFTEPCRKKKNHENQNKNTQLQGHTCSDNRDFPVLVPSFQYFYNRVFPALVTTFPCFGYIFSLFDLRFFCVFLKFQTYRDFPVLATIFLCFKYRVFPALTTSFFCFGYIISLFYEHFYPLLFTGFSLFFQNSMLLFFKEQGNPCYKNINMNVTIKCYIPVQNAYISLYFNEICTLQTLYTAKACKGGNTTQGIPCKKPVLSL